MKSFTKESLKAAAATAIGIAVTCVGGVSLAFATAGWNPAPTTPPGGNTPAPINVGVDAQQKVGALNLQGWNYINNASNAATGPETSGDSRAGLVFGDTAQLHSWFLGNIDAAAYSQDLGLFSWRFGNRGDWVQTWLSDGTVGIDTSTPTATLDVNGSLAVRRGCENGGCNGKVLTADDKGVASWQTPASGGSNVGWVTIDSNGVNSGNNNTLWVDYTSGDHSPETMCRNAGYTTFSGACKTVLSATIQGSLLANNGTYNGVTGWHLTCQYGVPDYTYFSVSAGHTSQILCIK